MRSRHPTYLAVASAGLLVLAGCSKRDDHSEAAAAASDAADAASDSAPAAADAKSPSINVPAPLNRTASAASGDTPDIDQTVAPGVAFSYNYAFTLPADAIAKVQQQHAATCEQLGPSRCQVTGMNYEQPNKGEVSARLDLMLAPDVAHSFGTDAVSAVEKADGSIDTAAISGDNAGGAIEESQRRSVALKSQLSRLETRMSTPGVSKEEKAQLAQRSNELREQLGTEQEGRQDKEASIAMTPMTFRYGSEGVFSANTGSFGKAAASSFGSLQSLAAFLVTSAGLLLPWGLVILVIVLTVRLRTMKQRVAQVASDAANSRPPQ